MSPDSVVLEMFFVRFPFGDPAVNEKLWEEIDEQQFAPDLRERLARNGFRVGLLSGQMPDRTVEAAGIERQAGPERPNRRHQGRGSGGRAAAWSGGICNFAPASGAKSSPRASIRNCRCWCASRASSRGQTYNQAQGIFAVKSFPQPDGRVRLELVPELHHDQPRQRWVGEPGHVAAGDQPAEASVSTT